jgi:GAF domain-containing protein
MQCPRCQHENRPQAKFCEECATPLNGAHLPRGSQADPTEEVEGLRRALTEALERQTATSEILGVISSSPTDLQPVMNAVADSAARLCEATDAHVYQKDGDLLRVVASYGALPLARMEVPISRQSVMGRAVSDRRPIHVDDIAVAFYDEFPDARRQKEMGYRTILATPLLREGEPIGAIVIRRTEVRPFSSGQVALLATFAAQAVIAIENVRLFKELEARNRDLTEALDQQTATSEILRVISRSQTDVQPVFDTIVRSAAQLCGAVVAGVFRTDGRMIHHPANYGPNMDALAAVRSRFPMPLDKTFTMGEAILTRSVVQVPDSEAAPGREFTRETGRILGFRSVVAVPMFREGEPIGVINVCRRDPGPFAPAEIELLKTFADQAVIAIENVRLFTELEARNRDLTQALEQQTATAEVLRVIGSSPTDAQPVFEAIVSSARRLLSGFGGAVYRVAGDELHLAAYISTNPSGDAALRSSFPRPLAVFSPPGEAIRRRAPVVLTDIETDGWIPDDIRELIRKRGDRSGVWVPMMREGMALGAIGVTRIEPASFGDEQIALLRTFADQAVIAIENVRLFKELEGRNRDLTATSQILQVISRSPTDAQPVFDAIAQNAVQLCDAANGTVFRFDGSLIHVAANHGRSPEAAEVLRRVFPIPPGKGTVAGRAILTRAVTHVPDVLNDPEHFEGFLWLPRSTGSRAILSVPLLRDGAPIGAIAVTRSEPGPFSADKIELLKTFADQAVIAIENVRLFTELQASNRELTTALDTQTATSDILRVISRSPTDVQPVFDAIAESAVRLCGADYGSTNRLEDEVVHLVSQTGPSVEWLDAASRLFPHPLTRDLIAGRSMLDREVVHVEDVQNDTRFPSSQSLARTMGYRTVLSVPMLRDSGPVGAIVVFRQEARSFSESEIGLLRTFADQAVIAIENVRLFTELQEKNRALTDAHGQVTEALERQTATSEILRVISSSPTDIAPVFSTIIRNAVQLSGAQRGALFRFDGEIVHLVAHHNQPAEALAALERAYPMRLGRAQVSGRAILSRAVAEIQDVRSDPEYLQDMAAEMELGSLLAVPMLRADGTPTGVIVIQRSESGPFAGGHVELLKTFADQAVIAIENVRLFKELEARTRDLTRSVEELRALGEIGQAISSTLDLRTVLSTIVARATQLSGTDAGVIYEYDEQREVFVPRATEHLEAEIVETMLATPVRKGEGATGRLAEIQEPIQVPDILAAPAESRVRGALVRAGYRALLAVPLVREGHLLGGLTVIRKATGAFPPDVVDVLKTFATQSALAIQNARLFHEIADKSRQLEAASQHKSEFLANMSHELRTPLNAIIGFSEVLAQGMFGEINAKQSEYLHDILESGRHLLSLINDILDLSKIEAGRMELEVSEFDLPQAIQNALVLVRERAIRRGITLGSTIDTRLGMISGDERKVKQVLLNLLSNALKFTPEGGQIDVAARLHDNRAEVSVADTGIGIAPTDQDAVFEEFRQVGSADKKAEGTGLGLALSRKFIELHGGKIWVQSELGRGSTFTFTLPVSPWPAS